MRQLDLPSIPPGEVGTSPDDWLAPPELFMRLGPFDLDPCAPAEADRPWDTALRHYTEDDGGLVEAWSGRVWLFPPRDSAPWLLKLSNHGDGIALLPAETETELWQGWVFPLADAVLFLADRLRFFDSDGQLIESSSTSSALVAFGARNVQDLSNSGIRGGLVHLSTRHLPANMPSTSTAPMPINPPKLPAQSRRRRESADDTPDAPKESPVATVPPLPDRRKQAERERLARETQISTSKLATPATPNSPRRKRGRPRIKPPWE